MKTVPADDNVRRGRLAKALQCSQVAMEVLLLADEDRDVADEVVTPFVDAGVAASEPIRAARLVYMPKAVTIATR